MSAAEQYVIDEKGNKVAIILPLTEYQHLREDLHDLAMVAERRDDGTRSLAGLKKACGFPKIMSSVSREFCTF